MIIVRNIRIISKKLGPGAPKYAMIQSSSFDAFYFKLLNPFGAPYYLRLPITPAWWCHQMATFSALLAICAGNSPVPGEFPAQRPVTRSFNVFFDLRLNKRLSNHEAGDLRRYRANYDVTVMNTLCGTLMYFTSEPRDVSISTCGCHNFSWRLFCSRVPNFPVFIFHECESRFYSQISFQTMTTFFLIEPLTLKLFWNTSNRIAYSVISEFWMM